MQCLTQLETDFRLIPKGCPAPCPFLSAPHVDREKVPLARGRHPEQEPQAPYNQPLTRCYQQRYSTWPAMPLSCATILAGSRLPLPAAAKPPLPFPTSSVQLCPCLPVSSTASTIPLQGDHQLPLPSLPSLQLPLPPSLSRGLLPLPDTGCDRVPGRGPCCSSPPPAGCGCHIPLALRGPCTGWDKAAAVPLSIMLSGAPPASPALLPLSLVPAACGRLSLALCLPPPPPTHGLRQRAGISCQCWAGDTQLRLLPICHPQGHLPLTSCSSAERHRDENPPTWQKAELNAGGWQK